MFRSKFALLAPVVLLLLILKGEAATISNKLVNSTTNVPTTKVTTGPGTVIKSTVIQSTVIQSNVSTTHLPTMTRSNLGGTLKRLVYVTLVLSAVIGFYFMVKFCRSGRRKPRKYGVIKTPGDMEMRPLESDDDDDEDVTMFNRKN